MASLPACPWGMGGHQPSGLNRIKVGKAAQSISLGWERCHWEGNLPSLIQRKHRRPPTTGLGDGRGLKVGARRVHIVCGGDSFEHWFSIAPGELGGSMCLSGTRQP